VVILIDGANSQFEKSKSASARMPPSPGAWEASTILGRVQFRFTYANTSFSTLSSQCHVTSSLILY